MINVALIPGWGGGPWHTKQFELALQNGGYAVTDPGRADIIIAHSVACYDLPKKTPAVLYVLIDPPYWPGQTIFQRYLVHLRQGAHSPMKDRGFKLKAAYLFWCLVYFMAKPRYTVMVLKNKSGLSFMQEVASKNVWIIRNQDDPFCSPDIQLPIASYKNVSLVNLPGGHDDYYTNPQPYISLLPKQL